MVRATKCRNCGIVPMPFPSGDKEYPFKLVHAGEGGCPAGEFGLETYQKTRDECIAVWNKRNSSEPS
jgi:hypothetical protein